MSGEDAFAISTNLKTVIQLVQVILLSRGRFCSVLPLGNSLAKGTLTQNRESQLYLN